MNHLHSRRRDVHLCSIGGLIYGRLDNLGCTLETGIDQVGVGDSLKVLIRESDMGEVSVLIVVWHGHLA